MQREMRFCQIGLDAIWAILTKLGFRVFPVSVIGYRNYLTKEKTSENMLKR